ncbi:MAG: 5-methyltetrahydropteroyltriglutamate--homocysteine methyltransferase [Gammaproteobacteria bacterium]|jgi:5-methyltetrahydropteroyltriglutamate--homocysteine methyltransferase
MSMHAQDDFYKDDEALAMDYAAAVNEEVLELFAAGCGHRPTCPTVDASTPRTSQAVAVEAINRALQGAPVTTAVHMCFGYASAVTDKPSSYSFLPELEATVADHISIEAGQPNLDLSVLSSLPSKAILVEVISMLSETPETPEQVAERIRAEPAYITPERLIVAPDCGMKYLPRRSAFSKLCAMVAGANIVRAELS